MANTIREFEIGDFLTKEFKEKSTKDSLWNYARSL